MPPFNDLAWTPGTQNFPGLVGAMYLSPLSDIATFPTLSAAGALDTTTGAIVCKSTKRFYKVYVTDETGGLAVKQIGLRDAKGVQTDLVVTIPGDGKAVAEQMRLWLNTPVVAIMKDSDGNNRIIGVVNLDATSTVTTGDIPAYIETFDGGSGMKRTDERGYKITIAWKAPHAAIYYKGTGGPEALLTPAV